MNILFVCAGNTCRSPMAEALARNRFGSSAHVRSAGVVARDGVGTANPHGIAVMLAHYGLDTRQHVPCLVDRLDSADFDLIIALDPTITERLKTRDAWQSANIITWDVADPIGTDEATYAATAQQIDSLIQTIEPAIMTPANFMHAYAQALASQQWSAIAPLMDESICVTFSEDTFIGLSAVQAAFEKTFALIKDETYDITNMRWVSQDETYAVCLYHFHWSGLIHGQHASGGGRGTSVLRKQNGRWRLLTEHLGPHARNHQS